MSRKIIALDWDGVINCPHDIDDKETDRRAKRINILNRIVKETSADILFTSTWRMDFEYSHRGVQNWFDELGIQANCIGCTKHLNTERGIEILEWIFNKQFVNGLQIDHLAIIDDDWDLEPLMSYFIKCNTEEGLTNIVANDVINMLQKPFNVQLSLGQKE